MSPKFLGLKSLVLLFIIIWIAIAVVIYHIEFEDNKSEKYPYLLNESKSHSPHYLLMVLILSKAKNFGQRNAMRTTWLSYHPEVKHAFAIGLVDNTNEQALNKENNQYHDLLLLNITDDYYHLSAKLLESLDYIFKIYNFHFLLKCDDDTFAVIENLLHELESQDRSGLYWGFFDGRANVKTTGKWKEPKWFLCDKYLPHAKGGGYILSSDLIGFISKNKRYLQMYNSEDVSMGVWLSALNIKRKHDPRFDTEFKSRGCNNKYLITHKISPEAMKQLHLNLKTTNRLCHVEFKKRFSYVYNWDFPPSQCCLRNNSSVP